MALACASAASAPASCWKYCWTPLIGLRRFRGRFLRNLRTAACEESGNVRANNEQQIHSTHDKLRSDVSPLNERRVCRRRGGRPGDPTESSASTLEAGGANLYYEELICFSTFFPEISERAYGSNGFVARCWRDWRRLLHRLQFASSAETAPGIGEVQSPIPGAPLRFDRSHPNLKPTQYASSLISGKKVEKQISSS